MAYTAIDKPTDYFETVLYTGDGTSSKAITGVGFQPDWVWLKARNHAYSHQLFDVVRGATKLLSSEEATAEQTLSGVTSFDSDGFTVGSDAGSNGSAKTFASWNWLAGGSASSNTDGDITSSVSANTTAGFSIVSWTSNGSNTNGVGHGLADTPKIIFYKSRNSVSGAWYIWINQLVDSSHDFLVLNNSNAKVDIDTSTYGTPSSTTISNFGFANNENMIAYCFTDIKGFAKHGSYTGNGNADGTFVYTGFKPAWVMRKVATGGTGSWNIYDTKREPANVMDKELFANSNSAEGSFTQMDFLSNGFKFRTSNSAGNGSGQTYIYMAFAESPFVNSSGVPNNAR